MMKNRILSTKKFIIFINKAALLAPMTEYNYIIGSITCGGDFAATGCGGSFQRLIIYNKNAEPPGFDKNLLCKKTGGFETEHEMRNLKTIIFEELRINGMWKPDALVCDTPYDVDIEKMLNSEYLDNYSIRPETLF